MPAGVRSTTACGGSGPSAVSVGALEAGTATTGDGVGAAVVGTVVRDGAGDGGRTAAGASAAIAACGAAGDGLLNDSPPNASDNVSTEESDAKSDNSKEREPLLSSGEAGEVGRL